MTITLPLSLLTQRLIAVASTGGELSTIDPDGVLILLLVGSGEEEQD
jgi:hypothetical protein